MRWEHPERGWVTPDEFIPIAERSGLIATLGSFAIEGACQAMAAWSGQGEERSALVISVNLSPH
jgi:EAL domain-containing protein (putative c-di-GMP-specific phosphodiesterase class I)